MTDTFARNDALEPGDADILELARVTFYQDTDSLDGWAQRMGELRLTAQEHEWLDNLFDILRGTILEPRREQQAA
jgi:hypothetical protein